jgi:hypothetical protein
MRERICAGLALTASYWAAPPSPAEPVDDPELAEILAAEAAAFQVRCGHPIGRPRQRRTVRRRV